MSSDQLLITHYPSPILRRKFFMNSEKETLLEGVPTDSAGVPVFADLTEEQKSRVDRYAILFGAANPEKNYFSDGESFAQKQSRFRSKKEEASDETPEQVDISSTSETEDADESETTGSREQSSPGEPKTENSAGEEEKENSGGEEETEAEQAAPETETGAKPAKPARRSKA
jgi:hypothetical protein